MMSIVHIELLALALIAATIAIIDFKTQTIPDTASAALGIAGFVAQAQTMPIIGVVASAASYFGIFWLIRNVHRLATGRIGLGFGDVKLAGAAGAWLSVGLFPLFIGVAALAALLAVFSTALVKGRSVLRQRIPFGPFMALSLIVCWVLQVSSIDWVELYGF